MESGRSDILPRAFKQGDESYLEFIETFRVWCIAEMGGCVQKTGTEHVHERHSPEATADLRTEEIRDLFNELPVARSWQRFMRSHQEMMWRRVRENFAGSEEEFVAKLTEFEEKGPGKLIYDPEFDIPKYARREIHLQPGGYTDDPLGGFVFHYGTKVFYLGGNNQDELHVEVAKKAAEPKDKSVNRILDLGCSIGQATIAMKQQYPEAEVWGLDVGLPLLQYGHMRAVERGIDVNFAHGLAEEMSFDDGAFDMVVAFILFHEVPTGVMKKIISEVHRVLRPGGVFTVYDFPNNSQNSAPGFRFLIDYDSRDNCEPYSPGFVASDFPGLLEAQGFELAQGVQPNGPYGEFMQVLYATRP